MLLPPSEHVLLLAERWLKLLSNLGQTQATLTAYRSALRHYFVVSTVLNLKKPGLKTWPPTSALSFPACLLLQPAPRFSCACRPSVSGMTFSYTWTSARSIRYPAPARPACWVQAGDWFPTS